MLTGEPHFDTIPLKGDGGRSVGWVDVHAFPWLSKTTGKIKGVIKYIRDITYRVQAQQTVEESLGNLQKALNGTVKALANTVESKDPYTAGHQRRVVQLARALAVLQHHERLDGSGYPHGLLGHDIIMEARILAVADVVEAIASHRPYRQALGLDQAAAEISRNQGVLYDPAVVQACLRLLADKAFTFH